MKKVGERRRPCRATARKDSFVTTVDPVARRGPRGPYARSERTQEAILDAAIEVFAKDGYRKGSLRNIADRVGISEAGILHHFRSKGALLDAVLARRDERANARFGIPSDDGRHALSSLLDLAAYNASIPGIIQLFSVVAAEATSPSHPAHDHFVQRYEETRGFVMKAIDNLASAGELVEPMDSESTARKILALWDGLQIQWLLADGTLDMVQLLREYLDTLLIRPL
jgi:AcrR family transcriptional regulator